MKKFTLLPFFLFFLIHSCTQQSTGLNETEENDRVAVVQQSSSPLAGKMSDLFPDTNIQKLYVYPFEYPLANDYLFYGKPIAQDILDSLGSKASLGLPASEEFYGVLSFALKDGKRALISRTPGMYSSTAISLWLYDQESGSVSQHIPLADRFGDEGAVQIIRSYLFFEGNKLHALQYKYNSEDLNLRVPPVDSLKEKHQYYLLNIRSQGVDTLSTAARQLKKKFASQLAKLAEL